MANTHVVLEGVKDYTLELLGTKARDEAAESADRTGRWAALTITHERRANGA